MNFSTAVVLFVLICIVVFVIRTMINDKKNGRSSCGGDCGSCGSSALCQDPHSLIKEYRKNK